MNTMEMYDKYMITGMVKGFVPIEVEKALNCTIFGRDGKEFLDCFSGISVTNAGHNHPKIIAAAKEQMEKLVHCCTYVYYSPKAGEFAKELAEITPGDLTKSFLGNSGAEAVEGAMRLAKQHTGKKEIIALAQSFHGRTIGTLSITGNYARKKQGGPYLPGIAFAPAPYSYRCPFGTDNEEDCGVESAKAFERTLQYQTSGDVAMFIAEPVMGEGGIIVPPSNYFKLVKQICEREGILFIADEVQSGFGRTGKMFAIEHYGVQPDIMAMAKGIASGFPLSAFIANNEIADAFKPGDHLSTFGGNPVSCAAGVANIAVMKDENLPENSATRGKQIMDDLKLFAESCALIGEVRGKGLMIGIELVKDSDKTPAAEETAAVRQICMDDGLLVGAGGTFANVIRLQPPLTISEDQANLALSILKKAIEKVSKNI